MIIFDPNIPETESRVQSEPIRNNLNALNERTNQLTPVPTSPVTTSVSIGQADKIYFEDNLYTPFSGSLFDLGASTGISNFNSPGTFKEVIVYLKRSGTGEAELGFIESQELTIREHSNETAATLINDINLQRVPGSTGASETVPDLLDGVSPLDDSIIICSILVTNNGQTGQRGAINPIFETDIIDIRPFVQRTVNNAALTNHINAPTLAQAHPGSVVTNDLIQTTPTTVTANATLSTTVNVLTASLFDPLILGFNPIVRFTSDSVVTAGTVFQTSRVTAVAGSQLTLSSPVTVAINDQAIRGTITLDRTSYDVVEDILSDVVERNTTTGAVQLKSTAGGDLTLTGDVSGTTSSNTVDTVGGKTASEISNTVDGYQAATSSNTASTLISRDSSGNFSAGLITANLSGTAANATTATNFSGALSGDVSGNQGSTSVDTVGGKTASEISNTIDGYQAATSSNTASTLVSRDSSGDFSAGTITASLNGNASTATTATNLSGSINTSQVNPGTFSGAYTFGGLLSLTPSSTYLDDQEIGIDNPNDKVFIRFDSTQQTGPNTSLSLPATPTTGQMLIIKDVTSIGTWRILGNGNNIDGLPSLTGLAAGSATRLIYDGTEWWTI